MCRWVGQLCDGGMRVRSTEASGRRLKAGRSVELEESTWPGGSEQSLTFTHESFSFRFLYEDGLSFTCQPLQT